MKGLIKRLHMGQKGFTLIELLVVIAILGVLAAVAIPNLASLMGAGDKAAADTELSIVQTAVVAYMATYGTTNASETDIEIYLTTPLAYNYTITDGVAVQGTKK